jgi:glycine/D-amino acid oxidase-like deaminating enzyme
LPPQTLQGDRTVDVAIVGGGFTGLSAALHLATSGTDVALCESQVIGFGASGRNGGQVIPGLKLDPEQIVARYGPDVGGRLVDFAGSAADRVFDLVDRYQIGCDPVRGGWIQGAHSNHALTAVAARARQWADRGVSVRMLDAHTIAALTGTTQYRGGWLDPRAGTVQPLAFARGLARAASAAGASIYQHAPVRDIRRDGSGWRVALRDGVLTAGQVAIVTGAYSGKLWPALPRTILTIQSLLVATEPLGVHLLRSILPERACVSETRKLALYFRLSPDDRLVFGGRGTTGESENSRLFDHLVREMHRFFPQLIDVPLAYRWSGQVALTMDNLPHIHTPAPNLLIALGYNGRGVAMATALGQAIASHLLEASPLPLPVTELEPVPWHAVRRPAMALGVRYYWLKDQLGFAS